MNLNITPSSTIEATMLPNSILKTTLGNGVTINRFVKGGGHIKFEVTEEGSGQVFTDAKLLEYSSVEDINLFKNGIYVEPEFIVLDNDTLTVNLFLELEDTLYVSSTGSASIQRSKPGGVETSIQFNKNNTLTGNSDFTYDDATKTLTVENIVGTITESEHSLVSDVANLVEWANVANSPTEVSYFTNDSGYLISTDTIDHAIVADSANLVEWSNVANSPTDVSYFTNDSQYLVYANTISNADHANIADSANAVSWGNISGTPDFKTVATSGSYTDLIDKPTFIENANIANIANSVDYANVTGTPVLSAVALSGSYNDLSDKPNTIQNANIATLANSVPWTGVTGKPTTLAGYGITNGQQLDNDLTAISNLNGTGLLKRTGTDTWSLDANVYLTDAGTIGHAIVADSANAVSWGNVTSKPEFFSGDYDDLTGKPTLFSGSYDDLTGKPTLANIALSGNYNDLSNTPTLFSGSYDDLTGKPTLANIALSGNYNDLSNTPTNLSQFTNDSGFLTGSSIIENANIANIANSVSWGNVTSKPVFSTVATSGSYDDLSNKPNLAIYIPIAEKGVTNGVVPLNSSGKINAEFLNLTGAEYKGVWDASTNTPTLSNTTGTNGHFYYVSVGGTQDLGNGSFTYATGSLVIYDDTTVSWNAVSSGSTVTTVNGQSGTITLDTDDINEGTTNKYYTSTRVQNDQLQSDWDATTGKSVILNKPVFSTVATTGAYTDLTGTPTLATVANTGNYNELTNKPTLFSGAYDDLTGKPTLANIALSGNYNELTNKPTLFSGAYNDLTGKPSLFSGDYNDLTNKPTSLSTSFDDITGKPTTLSGYGITDAQAKDADLTAIAALTGTTGILKKTAADTWELDTANYAVDADVVKLTGNQTVAGVKTFSNASVSSVSFTAPQVIAEAAGSRFTMDAADGTGPRLKLGTPGAPSSYYEIGAYNNTNNFDSKTRDLKLFSTARPNAFTLKADTGFVGLNNVSPTQQLDVTGNVKATGFIGDGSQITNISYTGLLDKPTLGTASASNVGDFAAASHTHAAGDITSGTLATARLGSGTASASTYLRGDQTWATVPAGGITALTGDVTASGSGSVAATLTNSGVTAGSYRSVTVDAKGRVTAGTNPTTLAGYGITDAVALTGDQTIAGTKTFSAAIAGSVTGSAGNVAWTGVTGKPTTLSGYGITDAQPLDADLTSIAGLAGTTGLLRKTAANTFTLDTATYLTGITSANVTTALGYTPYNSTNPNGYITGITSANVTTALGYTPYNSTNPNGYITSSGSITGSAGSVAWTGVTGKPTTLSGFGITDAVNKGVTTNLTAFSITPTTTNGVILQNPAAGGFNVGAGRMIFTSDIRFNSYFALNPDGHMAIVLRQDPAILTAVRGNGMVFGNLTGAIEGTKVNPGAQLELWANSVNPQENRLVPGAESPEKILDNVTYKVVVESSVAEDGNRYARMAIYKPTARGHDCVVDTGDVLDTLVGSDFTKTGLLIGHVFGSGASGWSIAFTNAKVTWTSFGGKNTDNSYLPVLSNTTRLTGPTNLGLTNAVALSQAGLDLEVMSTIGTIKGFLQSQGFTATQADGVETITRPLYCYMSSLLADLKDRGII